MSGCNKPYQRGKHAEATAARFLEGKGLRLLEQNYHLPGGEIDLIMQDREIIVFVEVRARSNETVATALETIDHRKQRRLIRAGTHYLQKHRLLNCVTCRFDVVILSGPAGQAEIKWIPDAFGA